MAISKHSQRLVDETPDPVLEDLDEKDFAAEDVDHQEEITAKRAILMCERCGATLATPDL
jgi:formylmethanofuran dehydrogenase subunit E